MQNGGLVELVHLPVVVEELLSGCKLEQLPELTVKIPRNGTNQRLKLYL